MYGCSAQLFCCLRMLRCSRVQVMVFQTLADKHGGLKKFSPTGTSVMVQGEIKATPEGVKQVPAVAGEALLLR